MPNLTFNLAYWINERESMRMRREAGVPAPWTIDPVMATVRFCNVRREDDKVTKYIRNSTAYSGAEVSTWCVVLARMVNRISSLDSIASLVEASDMQAIKDKLRELRKMGPIWGNAYTISTAGKAMDKVDYVVDYVVNQVHMNDNLFTKCTSCMDMFKQLTRIDGLGSFLAAQIIADLKNTKGHPLNTAPDWWTWSAHGPGSLRGLSVYFGKRATPKDYLTAIEQCYTEVKPLIASYVGELHMQDFQNCLCEFSKFCRVKDGDGHARNTYTAR